MRQACRGEVCRDAFYLLIGALDLTPEPEPPAPAAPIICFRCRGTDAGCPVCRGAGTASLTAQAAALSHDAGVLAA